jgi:hypothetical protein
MSDMAVVTELPATWAGTACAAVNGESQRETCAALLLLLRYKQWLW